MRFRKRLLLVFALFLAIGAGWGGYAVWQTLRPGVLRVDVLDVGQGDAILITTPNQTQLLIDTGVNAAVLSSLGAAVPLHDRTLDGVLLTHPDGDHIGGAPSVFEAYDVAVRYVASSSKSNELTDAVEMFTMPQYILKRGDVLILDALHNVRAEVLSPDASFITQESNDASLMLKLTYGDTCFLFTGDASKTVETFLVHTYGDQLDCDVLKVGHHGSRTSTDETFLGYVSPQFAAISLGKDNDFGHPHAEVLDTLARFNVETYRTDEVGTITFMSDGRMVVLQK